MLHHSRFLKTSAGATTTAATQSADRYSGNSNLILRAELAKEDNRQPLNLFFPLPSTLMLNTCVRHFFM